MKRRVAWAAGILVSVVVALVFVLGRRTDLTGIDALLASRTPPGTSHVRVSAVLDSLGVDHLEFNPERRELVAIWRRTYRYLFEEGSIQARFLFDERGALIRYELEELVTAT